MLKKEVVVLSDLHVGSRAGLTNEPKNELQEELFKQYQENIRIWKNPDIVIANGDLIDGKSKNDSSQTEQDVLKQCKIAFELLQMWKAKKYYLTYGTAFHVSSKMEGSDYEDVIVDYLNTWKSNCAYIRDYYDNLNINGVVFNVKHQVGFSTLPHGRGTSILKEVLWNYYKTVIQHGIKADIIIRSHVHYYIAIEMNRIEVVTTPTYQAADTKFGNRICSGDIDVGSLRYIVKGIGKWIRQKHLLTVQAAKPLLFKE